MILTKTFNVFIENPFKTWWKARKYFKIPKTKIKFFYKKEQINFTDCIIDNKAKFLDVIAMDLQWKSKFNTPRFEYNPYIFICLFSRFGFCIYPEITRKDEFGNNVNANLEYWEYVLDYIYFTKTLKLNNWWTEQSELFKKTVKYGELEDGSKDIKEYYYLPIYTHLFSLNKKGLKEFKKLYNK